MKTNSNNRKQLLLNTLRDLGFTFSEACQIRRIEMTLHRWAEAECGDSNDKFSRCLVRDETTGKPYWEVLWHTENKARRTPAPDRERGALKRLAKIIGDRNTRVWVASGNPSIRETAVSFYQQTDPRGCALYIIRPGDVSEGRDVSSCYTNGMAIAA